MKHLDHLDPGPSSPKPGLPRRAVPPASRCVCGVLVTFALLAAAHGSAHAASAAINAVGVENEYADVISQVGGAAVQATAIVTDPNTDPHTFEVSPKVAGSIAAAQLVVENGVGYDAWVDKIMAAAPSATRKVINVQELLGLPASTPNPHLWYDPKTMPVVAKAVGNALAALEPDQAATFRANVEKFDASLKPWTDAIAAFKAEYPNTPVATTEPVSDYMLQAAGADLKTPFSLEAAIMNGTYPSPHDVGAENALFTGHAVKAFAYNQQVTDALTQSFLDLAKKNGVPVVGVYETMPTNGYTYQTWMVAEVNALDKALKDKTSIESLQDAAP